MSEIIDVITRLKYIAEDESLKNTSALIIKQTEQLGKLMFVRMQTVDKINSLDKNDIAGKEKLYNLLKRIDAEQDKRTLAITNERLNNEALNKVISNEVGLLENLNQKVTLLKAKRGLLPAGSENEIMQVSKQIKGLESEIDRLNGKSIAPKQGNNMLSGAVGTMAGQALGGTAGGIVGGFASGGLAGGALALGTAGVGMATDFVKDSIIEAEDAIKSSLKLEQALRAVANTAKIPYNPALFESLQRDANDLADKYKNMFDNDDITKGQVKLIEGTRLSQNQIKQLMTLSIELAAHNNISIEEASDKLSVALKGRASRDLKLLGLNLKDSKTEAERFNAIMTTLSGTLTGSVDTALETTAGKAQQASQHLANLEEDFGRKLIPMKSAWLEFGNSILDVVDNMVMINKENERMQNTIQRAQDDKISVKEQIKKDDAMVNTRALTTSAIKNAYKNYSDTEIVDLIVRTNIVPKFETLSPKAQKDNIANIRKGLESKNFDPNKAINNKPAKDEEDQEEKAEDKAEKARKKAEEARKRAEEKRLRELEKAYHNEMKVAENKYLRLEVQADKANKEEVDKEIAKQNVLIKREKEFSEIKKKYGKDDGKAFYDEYNNEVKKAKLIYESKIITIKKNEQLQINSAKKEYEIELSNGKDIVKAKEKLENESYKITLDALEAERKLRVDNGKDTIEIDGKITDLAIKQMEYVKAKIKEANDNIKKLLEESKRLLEEDIADTENKVGALERRKPTENKSKQRLDSLQQNIEIRKQIIDIQFRIDETEDPKLKKELQDKIDKLTQGINGDEKIFKPLQLLSKTFRLLFDGNFKEANKAGSAFFKSIEKDVDKFNTYAQAIGSGLQTILQAKEQEATRDVDIQQKRVDDVRRYADRGGAMMLADQEKRLHEAQKAKAKVAHEEIVLNNALALSNAIAGVAKAGAEGGAFAPATIAAFIGALVAGYALVKSSADPVKYYTGTEYVDANGKYPNGIDTVNSKLTRGERVLTVAQNNQLKGIKNDELVKYALIGKNSVELDYKGLTKLATTNTTSNVSNAKIEKLLSRLIDTVDEKPVPELYADVDGIRMIHANYISSQKRRESL